MRPAATFSASLLALAAGCAPIPQGTPLPGKPVTARGAPGAAAANPAVTPFHVPADSTPSPEALRVLASIPEPLRPEERVPPAQVVRAAPAGTVASPAPRETPAAAPDTSVVPADTSSASIPVPSPTPVLGERLSRLWSAGADTGIADTTRPPARAANPGREERDRSGGSAPPRASSSPGVTAGAAPGSPASRPAPPGGCWRVQIAAPVKRAEAEKKRAAAESLLLLPVVVEHEAGLWKIRTRDCFERSVADGIRTRAKGSGFAGAFPFQAKR